MIEITDEQTLSKLRMIVQNEFHSPSPEIVYRLHRAWKLEDSEIWYEVDIVDNMLRVYHGEIDANRGMIYLDVNSIMSLVQQRIDCAIDAYNSTSTPYFRGM